jgi:hypothetical protein
MTLQLVDSGCTAEFVGLKAARDQKLKLEKLSEPITLHMIDEKVTTQIKFATWQNISIRGTNGTKRFTIRYYVADISEEYVLGKRWLTKVNPIIDWEQHTLSWRKRVGEENTSQKPKLVYAAMKVKHQSPIPANDAPEWVSKEFGKVFDDDIANNRLPPSRGDLDYRFELKPHTPWSERSRYFDPRKKEVLAKWLANELAGGRYIPSKSPYRCQMHLAVNDRVCCDYRPLNANMIGNQYPMPNLKELVESVARAKFITSLDMPKGYNQVRLAPGMGKYMAVEVNGQLVEPTVMQFGSKTAVPWFQQVVADVLRGKLDRGVKVYLDNIVIYADTQEEHDEILRWVLQQLIGAGFPLSPKKCEWSKSEALIGGFFVGNGRIRTDPAKIQAIIDWPAPTSTKRADLATWSRRFVGFTNFIKEDIKGFSDVAAPLTELQRKDTTRTWDDEAKTSLALVKALAAAAPILTVFDHRLPLDIYSDASNRGLGAHYTQKYDCGHEKTLGFYSRKLNPAQQRYHTTERELMAIVYALEHVRAWAQTAAGRPRIHTDHKALVKFMEKKKWNPRLERWGATLLDYMPEIEFIAGNKNDVADAMSRQWGGDEPDHKIRVIEPDMLKGRLACAANVCRSAAPTGQVKEGCAVVHRSSALARRTSALARRTSALARRTSARRSAPQEVYR